MIVLLNKYYISAVRATIILRCLCICEACLKWSFEEMHFLGTSALSVTAVTADLFARSYLILEFSSWQFIPYSVHGNFNVNVCCLCRWSEPLEPTGRLAYVKCWIAVCVRSEEMLQQINSYMWRWFKTHLSDFVLPSSTSLLVIDLKKNKRNRLTDWVMFHVHTCS